ncbi:SGNH/GDSL hydrolase family protein [Sphingomonas sp. ac-8]|uniref:SGNH/GDSL hydrolase family protein n=1 Tax=Sphingomonas sp. ac-8 TaxID=3242977 RepID=UPI003A80D17B
MSKISQLPALGDPDGTEMVPALRGNRTYNTPLGPLVDREVTRTIAPHVVTAQLAAATALAASRYFPGGRAAGEAGSVVDQLFAVDDGTGSLVYYKRTAAGSQEISRAVTPVSLGSNESGRGLDLIGRPSVAGLLASTAPARGAGSLWHADAHVYVEADASATDSHVTTAGGVKLYVQPGPRGYDARAFGARDDWDGAAGTNNFAVFEKMARLRPVVIVLPRSRNGTGVYMLDGTTAIADATGILLEHDPDVSLWIEGGIPLTFIKGIRSNADLRINYGSRGLGVQHSLIPAMGRRITELGRPGSALAGQLQVPLRLDFADAAHFRLSGWPNGAFAAAVPTSIASDLVQWGTPPADSFVATVFHVVPGDFIQAKVADLTSYLPAICVLTDTGWLLIRQSQTADRATILCMQRAGTASAVETSTANPVAAQTTYRFGKAALGIAIFDQRSFGLVLNGTVIRRYQTSSNIQRAGWAGGFGAAGNFAISAPLLFKNKKTFGLPLLRVGGSGDSCADPTVVRQSQFDFARQLIGGVGGCQIEMLTNLAHSGDTSAAQLARLQALNLSGAGYHCWWIDIGRNDIQTGVPVPTYVANVLAMVAYLRAAGVEPLVALPGMFYSQPDAQAYGQDGGATARSDQGAPYRLALMQALADQRVYCNLASFENMGAVVASLLTMKASPWGDPGLVDNIHPGLWYSLCMGYGWALTTSAFFTHAMEHDFQGGPLATPLPADYFTGSLGGTSTPRYVVEDRLLHLSYYLSVNGAALPDGTKVGTLPRRLRPRADVIGQLANVSAGLTPVAAVSTTSAPFWIIGSDGAVKVYGVAGNPTFLGISASWKI